MIASSPTKWGLIHVLFDGLRAIIHLEITENITINTGKHCSNLGFHLVNTWPPFNRETMLHHESVSNVFREMGKC